MRERPILFSGPMVRALLDGSKTQTRRVAMHTVCGVRVARLGPDPAPELSTCSYGQPGDRLWVRETWGHDARYGYVYRAVDGEWEKVAREQQWVSGPAWRPSIHMHRSASRLTLTITDVRVERLQAITWNDSLAEGVRAWEEATSDPTCPVHHHDPRDSYHELWDSLNASRGYGWDANPWVWVVSFERTTEAAANAGGEPCR